MGEYICGKDKCDRCGDCMACYSNDPCPDGTHMTEGELLKHNAWVLKMDKLIAERKR